MALKRNLIANYLGQGWTALIGLAFIPLYIQYIGIEAYGLIGIFALLQAWLTLLDVGMKPALSREMARFTGGTHSAQSIRDQLRSIEFIGLGIACLIAVGIWGASGWLASDWLRAEKLPVDTVAKAFTVMGMVTAIKFVEGIYSSAIIGLQRQVLLNVITSGMATLRGLGAVGILAWVSPTIEAFFIWQGLVSILTLVLYTTVTYQILPNAERAGRFSVPALHMVGHFAGGMLGITFLSLILTQVDKILLSRLLSLSDYGYYTLAATLASGLYTLVSPIAQAFFPRLTELHAQHKEAELIQTYHKGAQLVSVVMGTAAVILIIYSDTILRLWTRDAVLSARSAMLLSILSMGNLLHGMMWIPYQAQLAHGWTGLSVRINIVSVTVIVPAIIWATPRFGAEGAAWVWVGLNAGYVLIGIHFMYRTILTAERWRWYMDDILLPIVGAFVIGLAMRWLIPSQSTIFGQLVVIALVGNMTLIGAVIAAPIVRQALAVHLRRSLSFGESKDAARHYPGGH